MLAWSVCCLVDLMRRLTVNQNSKVDSSTSHHYMTFNQMQKLACVLTAINSVWWEKQKSGGKVVPVESSARSATGCIAGRLGRTDLFGFAPLWDKYWDKSPHHPGPCCEKARAQASALPSHPPTYVNRRLIQHSHTHTDAHRDTLTPLILQGFPFLMRLHLKTQKYS